MFYIILTLSSHLFHYLSGVLLSGIWYKFILNFFSITLCAICPIHWITAFGQQYESWNTWLSTFLRILIDLQYYISKITALTYIFKFIILQRLSQRSIISTVSSLMKPWKFYKSCNFWNEVFFLFLAELLWRNRHMKGKGAIFSLFLPFKITYGFNERRKIERERV